MFGQTILPQKDKRIDMVTLYTRHTELADWHNYSRLIWTSNQSPTRASSKAAVFSSGRVIWQLEWPQITENAYIMQYSVHVCLPKGVMQLLLFLRYTSFSVVFYMMHLCYTGYVASLLILYPSFVCILMCFFLWPAVGSRYGKLLRPQGSLLRFKGVLFLFMAQTSCVSIISRSWISQILTGQAYKGCVTGSRQVKEFRLCVYLYLYHSLLLLVSPTERE